MLHSTTLLQVNPSALCIVNARLTIIEGARNGMLTCMAQSCGALAGHVS